MVPLWKKKRTKRDKTEKKEERKSETADTPEELQLFSFVRRASVCMFTW